MVDKWWVITGPTVSQFLEGKVPDYLGRYYDDMLRWSDEELEKCHDQVQWCFPLHEESKHSLVHPVVTKEIAEGISQTALENLLKATDRYRRFFGIGKYKDSKKQARWCKDRDHNLLRITRIIRCLRLFGLDSHAREFYKDVSVAAFGRPISSTTIAFWHDALHNDPWSPLQKEPPSELQD